MGLMKTHPCAIASSGAGPSYGKPSPMNNFNNKNMTFEHRNSSSMTMNNKYGNSSGMTTSKIWKSKSDDDFKMKTKKLNIFNLDPLSR